MPPAPPPLPGWPLVGHLDGLAPPIRELALTVYGVPIPQGSKGAASRHGQDATWCRHCKRTHLVRIDLRETTKGLAAWRQTVTVCARAATGYGWAALDGPVVADAVFTMPRPAGHYGTGRNTGLVRASAPAVPGVKPDLSKLVRALEDALQDAGVLTDDSRIWRYTTQAKVYPNDPAEPHALDRPGVWVRLRETPLP